MRASCTRCGEEVPRCRCVAAGEARPPTFTPNRVPSGIPDGVTYNGVQHVGTKVLMLFTDAESGSTFTLTPYEMDFANILAAATRVRQSHRMFPPIRETH